MYLLGALEPDRIARPADAVDLAQTLRGCNGASESAVLFGGGTLQGLGAPPRRYDVAVDMTGIAGVLAYDPRDLTVSVRAGTRIHELALSLAEHGQFLPLDAPLPQTGTIGGALASGWSGPRRMTYGRPRDFVIGSTAVLADGTVATAGGMVVKNVSGYDMSKLYAGSLGTLAALVTLNFKTFVLAPAQRAAIAAVPDGALTAALERVARLVVEPTAALALRGFPEVPGADGPDGRLVLFFEGSQPVVARATRDLRSALGAAGVPSTTIVDDAAADVLQSAVDARVNSAGGGSATYRLAGAPSEAARRAHDAAVLANAHGLACETIADVRGGDVIVRVSHEESGAFEVAAVPFDDELHESFAHAALLGCPERLRSHLDPWGTPPNAIEAMRALKARFDPNGTLAPGRFVGGI